MRPVFVFLLSIFYQDVTSYNPSSLSLHGSPFRIVSDVLGDEIGDEISSQISTSITDRCKDRQRKGPRIALSTALAITLMASPVTQPQQALAVSGGGLDYANLDVSGDTTQFVQGNFKGKDFSQIIAKGTSFRGSNLLGCRFFKAYLVNADFSMSDAKGASFEDTSLDGANFDQADLRGSYFSRSLLDSASIKGANFGDAQLPPKLLPLLCEREDLDEINKATGETTRDSLMCP